MKTKRYTSCKCYFGTCKNFSSYYQNQQITWLFSYPKKDTEIYRNYKSCSHLFFKLLNKMNKTKSITDGLLIINKYNNTETH